MRHLQQELRKNIDQAIDNEPMTFPEVFAFIFNNFAMKVDFDEAFNCARDINRLIGQYHGDISLLSLMPNFNYDCLKEMEANYKQLALKIKNRLDRLNGIY